LLLRRGVDINQKIVPAQLTALHFAAYEGRTAVVRLLLNEGANANANTSSGRTPLDAKEKGKKEAVKLLIQAGGRRGRKVTFCCY
jgi:uncharacterized protein